MRIVFSGHLFSLEHSETPRIKTYQRIYIIATKSQLVSIDLNPLPVFTPSTGSIDNQSHAQTGDYRVDRETGMNHNVQQTQYAEDNQPLLDRG